MTSSAKRCTARNQPGPSATRSSTANSCPSSTSPPDASSRSGRAVHTHRLVSADGVTLITRTDEDVTRQWLSRQRLDTGPVVAYAGYLPVSRAATPIEPGGIAYLGYGFEDTSACPACQGEPMMPAEYTVHIEVIENEHDDNATVLYAHAVGRHVTSAIARNLSPAACRALLHDLEAARARGDNVDDVAATWAAMRELDGIA